MARSGRATFLSVDLHALLGGPFLYFASNGSAKWGAESSSSSTNSWKNRQKCPTLEKRLRRLSGLTELTRERICLVLTRHKMRNTFESAVLAFGAELRR